MTGSISPQFKALAEAVSQIVWVADSDGAWSYANIHWQRYTGQNAAEARGLEWLKAVHEDDVPRMREQWRNRAARAEPFAVEGRIRREDGEFRLFDVQVQQLSSGQWMATATEVAAAARASSAIRGNSVTANAQHADPHESTERWKFALEAAGMGAWELDLETMRASRSLRHDQIFGYQRLLPEWSFEDFLHHVIEADRERVSAEFDQAMTQQRDWHLECRIRRTDGELRWIRASGRAATNAQGQPTRMWGVVEDITQHKRSEQALRDSEVHFRSLANTAPAMLWISDSKQRCSFVSRGWYELTGQATSQTLGLGWVNCSHPDDRERMLHSRFDAAERCEPFQVEYRLRTRDGSYRWVLDAGRPRMGANGELLGYVGSVTDVHEMRLAREEQERIDELLHAVLDTTPDAVYVKDRAGRMLLANPAAVAVIGKPPEQVLDHTDSYWLDDPRELAEITANDARVMQSRRTEVVEEWMTTTSGKRLFSSTKSPLRDKTGAVIGLVGISRDITEHKRVERQVLESESRMRRLFDSAPANIAIFEGPEHKCVYINKAHARCMGKRRMLGLTVREAFPEVDGRGMLVRFDRVYHTGEAWVTPQVDAAREGREGECVKGVFHETVQPWLHDDGSVAGVMLMAFDITAEVELRRQVQESGARFRALADNIAQLAWMADERGRIFWYNRRWLDYTGTTLEDMQNSRWQNILHPDHAMRVAKKIAHCQKTGEALKDTFPLRGGDGQYRWFYSQAIPIRDKSGKVTRWFGTHTDVTEQRKAAQALEEADKRKNEFLAMLAHELRNPLAPVRYAVEILRNLDSSREAQVQARDMIDRQVAHMARLIDDLLDVSRITRGKIELRRQKCDLTNIVRKTVAGYQLSLRAVDLELRCTAPTEPLWMVGDPTRLTQIVGNLLHNAGKFTEPGGRVSVELSADARAHAALIRISDTGVGIEAQLLGQLFEPFSQATQTLDRSKGGLGLGLSLVKGLVELHGGTVEASSPGRGRGSQFTLRLPLTVQDAVRDTPPVKPRNKAAVHSLRVLIVEDNRDTADSLRTLLELAGHDVSVAFDGPSGVERARQLQPDVVLCDIGLPGGMDGYKVVKVLRAELAPAAPKFFALSGYGQAADRRQAQEAGFERHFVKPVDYTELSDALATLWCYEPQPQDAQIQH